MQTDQPQAPPGAGPLRYQSGFGNEFATEALPGALPERQNSPQRAPYGLYADQLSGTAFTAPRSANRRSWLYRIRPAAAHQPFEPIGNGRFVSRFGDTPTTPNQLRWSPAPAPLEPTDFIDGITTMAGNGSPAAQSGCGVHLYAANRSMRDRFFYNADGEMLIVPQQGRLRFYTEPGVIEAEPQEIVVIPRGLRFSVELLDPTARGYICENYGAFPRLPDLGVIGSNGLANPRDFQTPHAWYEQRAGEFTLCAKFLGNLWAAKIGHSPLDVVAFLPGGASLHNCMSGHGPDAGTFDKASAADTARAQQVTDTMAFMFETRAVLHPTEYAMQNATLQADYFECWQGLRANFDPGKP